MIPGFRAAQFLQKEFDEHLTVAAATEAFVSAAFCSLVEIANRSLQSGRKLLFFGNGGSAGDAQHIAAELTVRYTRNRPAIAAVALTTDTSVLTAIGNDLGFDRLFSRQVEALAKPGDVVIGITTSGSSANVVQALKTAKEMGCYAVGLTGGDGGELRGLADPLIVVPSRITARIQEMHITIGHALCKAIEVGLGYAD